MVYRIYLPAKMESLLKTTLILEHFKSTRSV